MKAIVTGTGRSGTTSVVGLLATVRDARSGQRPKVRHESCAAEIVELLRQHRAEEAEAIVRSFQHDIEVSPYLALMPARPAPGIPLVALVRDGRDVVRSGLSLGWFIPRPPVPPWEDLLPSFDGDRFRRACRYWTWANRRLRDWGATTVRLEDLRSAAAARAHLIEAVGLHPEVGVVADLPHRNEATIEKAKLAAVHGDSIGHWTTWTPDQRSIFEEICGEEMDRYDPRWSWSPPACGL